MNDSNLNDRLDGSSSCSRGEKEPRSRGSLTRLFIVGVIAAGLLLTLVPLWSVYRSIDPMEQRELFFQNDIVYINTKKVLLWIIVSFISPVAIGLLYLLFCSGFKRNRSCRRARMSDGFWKKNVLLRIFLAIPAGGLVVWLVSHLDFRWADRQAGGWTGIHGLGTLFLGPLIGPMALVAILFLIALLCLAWFGSDEGATALETDLVENLFVDDQRPNEKSGSVENTEGKTL